MLSSATCALYIALLASPGGQGRGSGRSMTPGAPLGHLAVDVLAEPGMELGEQI